LREKQDVARAAEERQLVEQQLQELEQQIQEETDQIARSFDPQTETLQEIVVRPNKADILLQPLSVLWVPFWHSTSGAFRRAWPSSE
jgi:hypothetical protein